MSPLELAQFKLECLKVARSLTVECTAAELVKDTDTLFQCVVGSKSADAESVR